MAAFNDDGGLFGAPLDFDPFTPADTPAPAAPQKRRLWGLMGPKEPETVTPAPPSARSIMEKDGGLFGDPLDHDPFAPAQTPDTARPSGVRMPEAEPPRDGFFDKLGHTFKGHSKGMDNAVLGSADLALGGALSRPKIGDFEDAQRRFEQGETTYRDVARRMSERDRQRGRIEHELPEELEARRTQATKGRENLSVAGFLNEDPVSADLMFPGMSEDQIAQELRGMDDRLIREHVTNRNKGAGEMTRLGKVGAGMGGLIEGVSKFNTIGMGQTLLLDPLVTTKSERGPQFDIGDDGRLMLIEAGKDISTGDYLKEYGATGVEVAAEYLTGRAIAGIFSGLGSLVPQSVKGAAGRSVSRALNMPLLKAVRSGKVATALRAVRSSDIYKATGRFTGVGNMWEEVSEELVQDINRDLWNVAGDKTPLSTRMLDTTIDFGLNAPYLIAAMALGNVIKMGAVAPVERSARRTAAKEDANLLHMTLAANGAKADAREVESFLFNLYGDTNLKDGLQKVSRFLDRHGITPDSDSPYVAAMHQAFAEQDKEMHPRQRFLRGLQEGWHKERQQKRAGVQMPEDATTGEESKPALIDQVAPEHAEIGKFVKQQAARPLDMATGKPLAGPDEQAELARFKAMPQWQAYLKEADGDEMLAMFALRHDQQADAEAEQAAAEQGARAQQEVAGEQDVQAGQPGPEDVAAQGDGTPIQAQMPLQGMPGQSADQQPAGIAPGSTADAAQDAVDPQYPNYRPMEPNMTPKERRFYEAEAEARITGNSELPSYKKEEQLVRLQNIRNGLQEIRAEIEENEQAGNGSAALKAEQQDLEDALYTLATGQKRERKDPPILVTRKGLQATVDQMNEQEAQKPNPQDRQHYEIASQAGAAVDPTDRTDPTDQQAATPAATPQETPVGKMTPAAVRAELHRFGVHELRGDDGKMQDIDAIKSPITLRRALAAERGNLENRQKIEAAAAENAAKKTERRRKSLEKSPAKGQFKSNVTYTQDDRVTPLINEINSRGGMRSPQFTKPGKLAGPAKLVDGNYDGIVEDGKKLAVPAFMGVFSKTGTNSPDQMLAALSSTGGRGGEAGFLPEGASIDDMWDAIREEVADYQHWKATKQFPTRARNMDQDQQAELLDQQENEFRGKQNEAFDAANAELAQAIESGRIFPPQTDVVADGVGDKGSTFRVESAYVGDDMRLYYDLTDNLTFQKFTVPVGQVTGLAPAVEDDLDFDVAAFDNEGKPEADDEQQRRDRDGQEVGTAPGGVPAEGLFAGDSDRGGRDAVQRGERAPDAGGTRTGTAATQGQAGTGSLFGKDEPFNLAGGAARNDAAIQAERDAQREKERKAKAAAADMSLLGDDPTGTEQAVFYKDAKGERVKVTDTKGWRIWIKQQPFTMKQRAERLKMFDALRDGPGGEQAAITFAAKLAGIETPKAAEAKAAEQQRRIGQAPVPYTPVRGMVLQDADGFIGPVVKIDGDKITLAGEGENGVSDLIEYDRNALEFDPQFQMDAAELAKTYPDEFGEDVPTFKQQSSPVAAPEVYKPVMTANSPIPAGLTYEQFKAEYENALQQGFKYTPKNAGFNMWSEQMANLADAYPEYEKRIDAEADAPRPLRFGGDLLGPMELPQGDNWTESRPGGLATSNNPVRGGIVDQAIASKKWFAIPSSENPNFEKIKQALGENEFDSRGEAFQALYAAVEQAGTAPTQAAAGEQSNIRTMDEDGRVSDGKGGIKPGDVFRTSSGRTTTPYPKYSTKRTTKPDQIKMNNWLIENAKAEAAARGDDFNVTQFSAMSALNFPPAAGDAANMYLFGEQPAVQKPILKPLANQQQNAKAAGARIFQPWQDVLELIVEKDIVQNTQKNSPHNLRITLLSEIRTAWGHWLGNIAPHLMKPDYAQARVFVNSTNEDPETNYNQWTDWAMKYMGADKAEATPAAPAPNTPALAADALTTEQEERYFAHYFIQNWVKNQSSSLRDREAVIGKPFFYTKDEKGKAIDKTPRFATASEAFAWLEQNRPAQSPAPAPKARAKVEVKSAKLNLSDEKQAQLKAIQDKLRANLSKNNGTLSMNPLQIPPVMDPENVSLAAQMAALYAEGGVKTFKQFAHNVSVDMADFWDAIKVFLHGAWQSAGAVDDTLDDISRTDAREVISAIDKAAAENVNTAVKPDLALRELINSRDSNQAKAVRMRQMASAEGITLKQLQERIEFELVKIADEIASRANLDTAAKYKALVELYENQPLLTARTSTSIENQAYSTPAPLAFISSYMAAADLAASVYEPTGGNGMLLIGLDKAKVTANELDPARASNLRTLGVPTVTTDDATAREPGGPHATIVMNPPFASYPTTNVDGYAIKKIEHVIALQALRGLAADGRAVMILGANREPGEIGQGADRTFLNYLHNHFNVADHFEIDGELYGKQGAKWPLRVIVLDGRRQDVPSVPQDLAPKSVDRLTSWDDIYTRAKEVRDAVEKRRDSLDADRKIGPDVRPEAQQPAPEDTGAVPGQPGSNPAKAGGRGGRSGSTRGTIPPRRKPAIRSSDDSAAGTPDEQDLFSPRTNDRTSAPGGRGSSDKGMDNQREGRDEQPADADGRSGDRAGTGDRVEPRDLPRGTSLLGQPQNAGQHRYVPASDATSLETLVPSNMAPGIASALEKLRDKVGGDIDEWVRYKLGYDTIADLHRAMAAEQVDGVALAIDQIENGGALIIADETGIGKGRQAAGIMRYAQQNGIIPIFFTKDAKLFSDLQRDANDVGYSFNPFILGSTDGGADVVDETGRVLFKAPKSAGARRTAINSIIDKGIASQKFDTVIATYPQINVQNDQQRLLTHLSRNERVMIIMDEAHEASGSDSMQGAFFRGGEVKRGSGANRTTTVLSGILNGKGVKGVVYLSATYAKRPDNAPLYFRTLLGRAADNINDLVEAMSRGGVALQQAVAEALSSVGQLVRRERDFSGVVFERKIVQQERADELASKVDDTTSIFREIKMFSNLVRTSIKRDNGPGARATAMTDAQVDYTPFASIAHNYISQMLLATKVDAVVEEAVAAHQRGEKPVIALMNTQEAMMDQFAEQNGWRVGDPVSMDFRDMLRRALDRTLRFSVKDPQGNAETFTTTAGELGLQDFYDRIIEQINDLEVDIPTSPIDAILQGLRSKGLRVGELTGRQSGIRYADSSYKSGIYERRQKADKNALVNGFNNGDLDALILNASGSTGLSIHASPKFKERPIKTRNMIIAQPHGDINVMVQTLGRIKRTGMIPGGAKYSMPVLPLEAERRPAMVLERKMKSLNANTTAAQEGGVSLDQVDFMNRYGDQIVAQYMFEDNPALQDMLDMSPEVNERTGTVTPDREDFANVFAGRMALMPNRIQKEAYAAIIQKYTDYIAYLKATDQYELEIAVHDDWDGVMISEETLRPGTSEANIFEADTKIQRWEIKDTRHVPTAKEMQKDFEERSGSAEAMQERIVGFVEQIETAYSKIIDESETTVANPDITLGELSTVRKRLDHARNASAIFQSRVAPVLLSLQRMAGEYASITNEQEGIDAIGMITGITLPEQTADRVKASPGSIVLHIMTNQPGGHSLRVPLSQVGNGGFSIGRAYADESQVDVNQTGGRFERQIISGNPIRAINAAGNRGRLVSFKTREGKTITGLLMPMTWTPSQLARDPRRDLVDGAAVRLWLDTERSGVESDVVRLTPRGYTGQINISVPAARATGSKYFLDDQIRAITGDFNRVGNRMIARVDVNQIPAIAARLSVLSKARFRPSPGNMSDNMAIERVRDINGQVSGTTAQAARGATTAAAAGIARTAFEKTMQAEADKTPWAGENASAVESLDALPAPVRQAIARGEGRAARSEVNQDKLGFYSALGRAVERMDFKAMPAKYLVARLEGAQKNGAFKLDEYEEIGLADWLKGIEGKVTKDQVLDFIEQGGPKLEEVVKEDASVMSKAEQAEQRLRQIGIELGVPTGFMPYMSGRPLRWLYQDQDGARKDIPERYVSEIEDIEDARRATDVEDTPHGDQVLVGANTKFGQYQLPGGENYREVLIRLPVVRTRITELPGEYRAVKSPNDGKYYVIHKAGQTALTKGHSSEEAATKAAIDTLNKQKSIRNAGVFTSSHWPEDPNILVHMRLNDRVTSADGTSYTPPRKTLFIEEIQSDWHQRGREEGYKKEPDDFSPGGSGYGKGVPAAPFKRTPAWSMLAFKRVLRMAAEQGYDAVAWTPGEVQNERYSLAKQVDTVSSTRKEDGQYRIEARKDGVSVLDTTTTAEKLPDVIGKELAAKIVAAPDGMQDWSGLDLEIGGDGMKGFYDKILPTEVAKYLKKLDKDAAVGKTSIDPSLKGDTTGIEATKAKDQYGWIVTQWPNTWRKRTEAEADALIEKLAAEIRPTQQVWSIPVTEKMRATILNEGQARYMRDGAGQVRAVTMGDKSWFILDRYNNAGELAGDIREEAFHRIENEFADPVRTRRLGIATYGGKWQSIAREIEKNYGFKPGSVEFFRELAAKAYRDGQTNRSLWGRFVDAIVATIRRIGRAAGMKLSATDSELRDYVNSVIQARMDKQNNTDAPMMNQLAAARGDKAQGVTAEQDAAYLAAVETEDWEKAQRMVNRAWIKTNNIPQPEMTTKALESLAQFYDNNGVLGYDEDSMSFMMRELRRLTDAKEVDAYHVTDAPKEKFASGINGTELSSSGRTGNARDSSVYVFLDPDDIAMGYDGILSALNDAHTVIHLKIPIKKTLERFSWDGNFNVTYGTYSGIQIHGNVPAEWIKGFYSMPTLATELRDDSGRVKTLSERFDRATDEPRFALADAGDQSGPVEVRPGVFRTEDPNDVPDGAPFLQAVKTENGDTAWEFKPPAHLDKPPAEAEFEKEKAETMWNQAMDMTMASIGGLQRHGSRWKATDKQIAEYRRNNPKSSWDDVYANVPSRYKSAAAMAEAHIRDSNQRPNITWVDLLASTIHHYGEKVPGLRNMVESASRWMDNKFKFESLVFNQGDDGRGDSDLEAVRKFTTKGRPALKAISSWQNPEWVRLEKYLWTRDMNAKGYRAVEDDRNGGWMVFGLDGKPVKQGGALQDNFTYESQAWEAAHQLEANDLRKEGYSAEAAEMLLAVRRINDRAYEQIRGEVQTAQDELDDLGLPMPKIKKADGEMGDLWEALREMGDRRGYYMPRMRRSGKFKLSAVRTSDGARFLQLFDTGLMRWAKMRELRRQGYDQFSQSVSDRPSETSYMDVSVLALNDQLQKALDKIKKTEKESRGLESINISSRWEDYKTLNGKIEKHFVIEGGVTSKHQHRILKDAGGKYMTLDDSPKEWRFINPKGDIEKRLVNALLRHEITKMQVSSFAETITENIADLIHQRGSRSHKIARDGSTGKEVWQGYETDALKAITLSGKSIAGGTAKRLLAKEFMRSITGQTETWRQYRMRRMTAFIAENTASRVTAEDIDAAAVDWYHDYADEVAKNRIDSATQGNAYDEAVSYAREMLRNETRSERVIGTLKGLTATKYMSSLFSGLVNFTSLVTHSGPAMSAFADIPMLKTAKLLTRSASDYVRWQIHQKTGKGQGLDTAGAELFNEIHARGWDSSQIHHEALAVLQRRSGMVMQKFTESHLLAYSVVERLVRMSTIAATYRGIREQHKGEWTAKDNEAALNKGLYVSNKANSVFGKTNLPAWTRGPSVGAQTLRSMYMFQGFAHNTYLLMKEIAVDKKNFRALAWMLVAPALLAGPQAFIPRQFVVLLAKMVFKAFGVEPPEDPEEEYYQWIEEYFSEQLGGFAGRTAGRTARYGLLGAANINLSGSLGVRTFELDKWYDWFGAPGSAVLDYIKAGEYAAEGNALKAAETLLPRFEANFVKAYREASEGLTGENNMPLFDGDKPRKATTGETILRAAGANPASIAAMRETQWADRKIESEYAAMRSEISARYRKWLLAPQEQRSEKEKDKIAEEIKAYNKRVTDKGLGAYGNVPYYDNRSINAVERSMVRPPKRELIRAARRAAAEADR